MLENSNYNGGMDMWRSLFRLVISCVLTLALLVIWRTAVADAATSPVVTVLQPVAQGLRAPVRMALDAEGNYYVADTRNSGIIKFNNYGVPIQTIRTAGVPQGIAIAQDGKLLVSQGTFVAILDADGNEAGRLAAQFKFANGIAVDDVTGFIYVVDSSAHQVLVFTASGSFVKSIGSFGKVNGLFSMPTGIAFEKISRQLVVADTLNRKIQFFTVDGVFIKAFSSSSVVPFYFASPQGIAFEYSKDPQPVLSRMYVVDSYQAHVQVIDPNGNGAPLYLAGTNPLNNHIGRYGTLNGQLMVPSDVVFDQANSRLIVVNGFGNLTQYGIDGGVSPASDTAPPALAIDPVPATVLTSSLTLTGTVETDATLEITSSRAAGIGQIHYTSATTWQCDLTELSTGDTVITATARDAAGNSVSSSVNISVMLPAPALGLDPANPITNAAQQTISGTVEEGAVVTVTNSITSETSTVTINGATWHALVNLAEGVNKFNISAQKPMSVTATVSTEITLDSIAPWITVSALSDNSYTSTQVQNISGSVSDSTGAVALTLNNQPVVVTNGSFSVAVTLATGSNQLLLVASDQAGNAATHSRTIFFDASQPVITVNTPMDNSATTATVLTMSGTVDKAATVVVAGIPALADGNAWSASVPLAAGLNTIEIVATDLLGNRSTVKRTVTQDSVRPTIAITLPAQDVAVNRPGITVEGILNDSSDTGLVCDINGLITPVTVTNGTFNVAIDLTAEGVYPLLFIATDAAGNKTYTTRTVIFDATPPGLSVNTVNGIAPETLSGTVEVDATVSVREGDVNIGTVTTSNGVWTADLAGVQYDPAKINVLAVDVAGNSSSKTLTYVFPDGDISGDGRITVQDAIRALRLVVNQSIPSPSELAHGDIGPLLKGMPNPNGKIDLVDAILILRKAVGVQSW